MKQLRFFMTLGLFLFAAQAFGDNVGLGGYNSSPGLYGNAYNRSGSTNRNAYRQPNTNTGSSLQSAHSPGYFPLGSDLVQRPVQRNKGQASGREAN